jgi:hypothetical protein
LWVIVRCEFRLILGENTEWVFQITLDFSLIFCGPIVSDGASMVAFLEYDVWIWGLLMGYTEWVS